MTKARKLLKESLGRAHLMLEVLDARVPASSQNPMLAELRGPLPCVRVLARADLADPVVTQRWASRLRGPGTQVVAVDATRPKSARRVVEACRTAVPRRASGRLRLHVVVVGIPNVGKSTVINLLAGKKKAQVSNRPGVTLREDGRETESGLWIVDTPGLLWPNLEDQVGAHRLATLGSIGAAAFDPVAVAVFALTWLLERYPQALVDRYGVPPEQTNPDQLLSAIALQRGWLLPGQEPNRHKASEVLLRELRAGKLGRFSLEEPPPPGDRLATNAPAAGSYEVSEPSSDSGN